MIPTAIQAKIREERQMTGRCGCAQRNRTSLALSCPSFVCCLLKPCCTFHSQRRLSFQMRVVSIRGKYSNACQDNQTTKEGANICQNKRQQRTSALGRKRNMVPITSLLNNTYRRLPLCLLYPSHPRSFPNQHSFPSNSLPPQTKVYGKASQEKKR